MAVAASRLTRIALIVVGSIVLALALYIGSFFVIRWAKPGFLLSDQNEPVAPYRLLYLPLRWLTADRPAFLPLWSNSVIVRGTVTPSWDTSIPQDLMEQVWQQQWQIQATVGGVPHVLEMGRTGPPPRDIFDRHHTLVISSTVRANPDFTDTRVCTLDAIDP